jgi:hypothetical protein
MIHEERRCDWCKGEATSTRTGERLCDQHTQEFDQCKDLAQQLKGYIEPSLLEWSVAKAGEGYQGWQIYDALVTVGNELTRKGAWEISKEVAARQHADKGESMQRKSEEKFTTYITIEAVNLVAVMGLFSQVHAMLGRPDTDRVDADLNLVYVLTESEIERLENWLKSGFQSYTLHKVEERGEGKNLW